MKLITGTCLLIFATTLYAQDPYVSIGTCVLKYDPTSKMRVLTNDVNEVFDLPNNGMLVTEISSPVEAGTIVTAFPMTIKRIDPNRAVAQTPFGELSLVDGRSTTLSSPSGNYLCTRD